MALMTHAYASSREAGARAGSAPLATLRSEPPSHASPGTAPLHRHPTGHYRRVTHEPGHVLHEFSRMQVYGSKLAGPLTVTSPLIANLRGKIVISE
ncbi:hypothetical protein FAIPA1_420031 [Frankia sp. AiPs1]